MSNSIDSADPFCSSSISIAWSLRRLFGCELSKQRRFQSFDTHKILSGFVPHPNLDPSGEYHAAPTVLWCTVLYEFPRAGRLYHNRHRSPLWSYVDTYLGAFISLSAGLNVFQEHLRSSFWRSLNSWQCHIKVTRDDLVYIEPRAPICCLSSVGHPPSAQSILSLPYRYLPPSRGWSSTIAPRTHTASHHIKP